MDEKSKKKRKQRNFPLIELECDKDTCIYYQWGKCSSNDYECRLKMDAEEIYNRP